MLTVYLQCTFHKAQFTERERSKRTNHTRRLKERHLKRHTSASRSGHEAPRDILFGDLALPVPLPDPTKAIKRFKSSVAGEVRAGEVLENILIFLHPGRVPRRVRTSNVLSVGVGLLATRARPQKCAVRALPPRETT